MSVSKLQVINRTLVPNYPDSKTFYSHNDRPEQEDSIRSQVEKAISDGENFPFNVKLKRGKGSSEVVKTYTITKDDGGIIRYEDENQKLNRLCNKCYASSVSLGAPFFGKCYLCFEVKVYVAIRLVNLGTAGQRRIYIKCIAMSLDKVMLKDQDKYKDDIIKIIKRPLISSWVKTRFDESCSDYTPDDLIISEIESEAYENKAIYQTAAVITEASGVTKDGRVTVLTNKEFVLSKCHESEVMKELRENYNLNIIVRLQTLTDVKISSQIGIVSANKKSPNKKSPNKNGVVYLKFHSSNIYVGEIEGGGRPERKFLDSAKYTPNKYAAVTTHKMTSFHFLYVNPKSARDIEFITIFANYLAHMFSLTVPSCLLSSSKEPVFVLNKTHQTSHFDSLKKKTPDFIRNLFNYLYGRELTWKAIVREKVEEKLPTYREVVIEAITELKKPTFSSIEKYIDENYDIDVKKDKDKLKKALKRAIDKGDVQEEPVYKLCKK